MPKGVYIRKPRANVQRTKWYCIDCHKIISKKKKYCRSCWQKGENNNTKRLDVQKKLSAAWKRGCHINPMLGKKHKKSTLRLFSKLRLGKNNPNYGKVTYGTGRCKWYDYISPIAGIIQLQGTYELRMAKVLDLLNWQWQRNKDYFKYDNGAHTYIPDFKITKREDDDCLLYIDTKGWFPMEEQVKIKKVREENNIILFILDKNMLNEYERRVA